LLAFHLKFTKASNERASEKQKQLSTSAINPDGPFPFPSLQAQPFALRLRET
jgi:hypothetical protein